MLRKIIALTSVILIVGCTVGPDYKRPDNLTSNKWATTQTKNINTSAKQIDTHWWKKFNDPILESYLNKAIQNNYDLKITQAKLEQARALRAMEASRFYPQVNGDVSVTSLRISQQGKELGFIPGVFDVATIDRQRPYYNVGFDALWEMDVFGQNKRIVESKDYYTEAVQEQQRDVLITLLAEVARNYVDIRSAQRELKLTREQVELEKKIVNLTKRRNRVGTVNDLELEQALSELHAAESLIPKIEANYQSAIYQLAVLVSIDPDQIRMDTKHGLPNIPKFIPVGLRSDILRRRPDVRMAERQLAQATAEIGVAVADLYPKFTLDVNPAFQSLFFNKLFNNTSGSWMIGPFMNWNLFNGGRVRANITSKQAEREQMFLSYQKTILNALKDTEDALTRFSNEQRTYADLKKSAASNYKKVTLSHARYINGEDDLLSVLRNKKELNQSEINMLYSHTKVINNLISLYKSLGGGWESFEDKPTKI